MNPLFQMMGGMNPMMQKLQQFMQSFKGDPQQAIQQMLNSGKVSQEQYNHAVQTANQVMKMFGNMK